MALYKCAAERRLRESECRFAATLASFSDAVIATDHEGNVAFMNPAAEVMTGWNSGDAANRPLSAVFSELDSEVKALDVLTLDAMRAAGKMPAGIADPQSDHVIGRASLVHKDGREFTVDYRASPILDEKRRSSGAVLVFRDITQTLAVEAALRGAQEELERVSRIMTMGS